ncbi:leucine-rich repeats and immunoglobulin-like domains protein 1 isoform X2 [Xenia sp. Carnegie-2017]|uniref:leucine-rich repeats and immunoglobulin-like domains protein 1 isoform X2 n=1 Tax=Xenia sp. Carnegie-2017 TaxID=2897299 RepID=UPI001F049F84|nr:leucine-rich repeats and immunoglobulin-like domains protein 1 isoform X2 [Xenia sp. Carnegie-2017]
MGNVSKSFALNILGAPKIINKSKGIKTVHVYKDSRTKTRLICNIQKGNPEKFVVVWEGQFTQCFEDNCKPNNSYWEEITNKENVYEIITTSTKSTLILLEENVKNYFYQCTVENTFGRAYQQWKVVPVKGSKPLQAVEHHVFVDEMKKAKLSCKVTSQTSTLISWTFNNKPIYVGSRVEIVNTSINNSVYNSLFIDNVNVSDSGTYTCYGHFAGVLVVETITLSVRVLMAPNVSLNNIVQRQDSSFEIDCHASGYPPPEIEWKKTTK